MKPLLSLTLAAALIAGAAQAHHGFTGRYDRSTPIFLNGAVTQADFGYPHAVIGLNLSAGSAPQALVDEFGPGLVSMDSGMVTVELPPVRQFNALEARVAVGDTIQMVVLRNCEAPHQLRAQWINPADDQPVLRSSRWQEEVAAC
ncbi:MAG: DUF6152 family protein [Paracoccus sp. (in: a-proteobacteria)]|uniref:DUF6152 family protein n=1 Tax=Paracoccus sp. TaxID=267 RepID=UPI0026E0AFEE|nr:DUF6152 family protein [Paracoccus sp. (in: a-proteobacteria)]MDO5632386.1 DUF6152 family protein [Paracoccus sp. (in: a-proteobacteria)]